jgi:hypothetical protein
MKVKRIKITNIMGIDDILIDTSKQTTIVSGENGAGKTSIFEAIRNLISGGHDAKIIRSGNDTAETVIEFDEPVTITKSINEKKSETVVGVGGHNISSPMKYVAEVFGAGFNPVAFLSMKPEQRVDAILKAIPLQIDRDLAAEITGYPKQQLVDMQNAIHVIIDWESHGLKILADLHKLFYETRTIHNNKIRSLTEQVKTISESLITTPEDLSAEIDNRHAYIEKLNQKKQELATEYSAAKDDLNKEETAALDDVRAKFARQRECIANIYNDEVDTISKELQDANSQMTEMETKQSAYTKQTSARETAEKFKKDIYDEQVFADGCSNVIYLIADWKKEQASQYQIAGMSVEIKDKELLIDGLPFDKLNKAKQIKLAVSIGEIGLGKARIMIIDGIEALDSNSMELLEAEAVAKDIQLMLFKVTDTPLQINTEDTNEQTI